VLYKGRVIAHKDVIYLKDCKFKVSEVGRKRVLREKQKNVHAFVEGEESSLKETIGEQTPLVNLLLEYRKATYNPYKSGFFIDAETGNRIEYAQFVVGAGGQNIYYKPWGKLKKL
jgi:hypothetical protein